MDKMLRPERFDARPNTSESEEQWTHWHRTFVNYVASVQELSPNKLDLLINYVSSHVYKYIAECDSYESSIDTLKNIHSRTSM